MFFDHPIISTLLITRLSWLLSIKRDMTYEEYKMKGYNIYDGLLRYGAIESQKALLNVIMSMVGVAVSAHAKKSSVDVPDDIKRIYQGDIASETINEMIDEYECSDEINNDIESARDTEFIEYWTGPQIYNECNRFFNKGTPYHKLLVGFSHIIDDISKSQEESIAKKNAIERILGLFSESVSRAIPIEDDKINTVSEINDLFMAWVSRNPNKIYHVHWEALEKIVAEVLASHGFSVEITARMKGRYGDIVGIKKNDSNGNEIKYLVECKHYHGSRVGMDVVQKVIGAAIMEGASYSMLVTTSDFTRDVNESRVKIEQKGLSIHNGKEIAEWLESYRPREDHGLWIYPKWKLY